MKQPHNIGSQETIPPALPDSNSWAVPIFTSTFPVSSGISVPATQMEVKASLFVASHFPEGNSSHRERRQINLDRKHSILSYVDVVELNTYASAVNQGLVLNELEGVFKPNTNPVGPPPIHTSPR